MAAFRFTKRQALVLTNDGSGTADDLRALVSLIRSSVKATFGLSLAVEPTEGRPTHLRLGIIQPLSHSEVILPALDSLRLLFEDVHVRDAFAFSGSGGVGFGGFCDIFHQLCFEVRD